jgi:hypothetical protein
MLHDRFHLPVLTESAYRISVISDSSVLPLFTPLWKKRSIYYSGNRHKMSTLNLRSFGVFPVEPQPPGKPFLRTVWGTVPTFFMNNSGDMDYSRTEVIVAARQWLTKL